MKIICSQESLFSGLQTVQKAISNETNLPIYSGILFEAKGDKVHLFATDLSIGIDCYIPAKVEEEGSTVMPHKIITSLVQKLPGEEIIIESSEGVTTINAKHSKYKILGFKAEEFASFPQIKPIISCKISQGILKKAIEKTIFAASREETRAFLNGALFDMAGDKLAITTTDSHRLSHTECDVTRIGKSEQDENKAIIPKRTLLELLKLLNDSNDVFVNVNMEERQTMFVLYPEEEKKSIRVYSRLIAGEFPDYKQIVPQKFNSEIKVAADNLKKTIERVSLFTEDSMGYINISIGDIESEIKLENECEMTLDSEMKTVGQAKEKMACFKEGKNVKFSVNSKYILDILNVIEEDDAIIKIVDEKSPITVIPKEEKNCFHIVMPILKEED